MRSSVCLVTLASFLLLAAPALADEPAPAPAADAAPAGPLPPEPAPAAPAPAPAPPPATLAEAPAAPPAEGADKPAPPADEASRDTGIALALDLGFQRAFHGAADRLNSGTPTLLPIGVSLGIRTSKTFMIGAHGYAALASRDDCISEDRCRARGYGFGAHVEGMLARGHSWVFWLRYGLGYELLYQGGQPFDPSGHVFRSAIDIVDLRTGLDFTIHRRDEGKTARIGPFLGLVAGSLVNQSGFTRATTSGGQQRSLDRDAGSVHVWFAAGVRATLDP